MASREGSMRRGPALLMAASAVVVTIGVLGAFGVVPAPDPAAAAAARAAVDRRAPLVIASEDVAAATSQLVEVLQQPALDAAVSDPVDPADVPEAPEAADDPEALPADSGEGRRVVYSIHGQRVWLVESNGRVSHSYPVSGRLDRPDPATYEVYSRTESAISHDASATMRYLVRFAYGESAAIGFHDIPVTADGAEVQTNLQLGEPLSAGSVRQAEDDALLLWEWAPVGTTVVVVP